VPRFGDVEAGQNLSLGLRDLGWEGLGGAVDRDGRRAQRPELLDDLGDGQTGAFLDVVGDGQGGDDDREVGLDGVAGAVEHWRARKSLLDIRNERSTRHSSW